MNPILKNVIAVVIAIVAGYIANMGLIMLGPNIVPLPEGMVPEDPNSIKEHMGNMQLGNFVMVWLAHAAGAFVSAFVATKIAASNSKTISLALGGLWLIGGIMMVNMVGGPPSFIVADLVFAYIPMAYLGWILAGKGN